MRRVDLPPGDPRLDLPTCTECGLAPVRAAGLAHCADCAMARPPIFASLTKAERAVLAAHAPQDPEVPTTTGGSS